MGGAIFIHSIYIVKVKYFNNNIHDLHMHNNISGFFKKQQVQALQKELIVLPGKTIATGESSVFFT